MTTGASPSRKLLQRHVGFLLGNVMLLLLTGGFLRALLLAYNYKLASDIALSDLIEAFVNGMRFDLRVIAMLCLPLVLATASVAAMRRRQAMLYWLGACGGITILLGIAELNFYQEFHQRLNGLVYQYIKEDPATVLSMLWHGFPVARLLAVWAVLAWLYIAGLQRLSNWFAPPATDKAYTGRYHWLIVGVCLLMVLIAARGTLRQGPPLRWGDAYTTPHLFSNHLGLNNVLTLYDAAKHSLSGDEAKRWKPTMPAAQATAITRQWLLAPYDQLVDPDSATVRRRYSPPADKTLGITNVVVILLESFAGHFVGALGSDAQITPNFDKLATQGLLFTRFFANGTHTHQGMFATMGCFPNLPGFEYLMQSSHGGNKFSGLPQLLSARNYDNLYVYNGDFAWDNQRGYFSNQGMTRFIGRGDYVNPVVQDPTWGVSDQDMFTRAAAELAQLPSDRPFYALLQSLSNHTPYALPAQLPVAPVSGHGALNDHLTAMRYSDWALGQFFEQAQQQPYYRHTLFVVLGDHGFGAEQQLTELDLFRFHVPMLLLAPGIQQQFGRTNDAVGTQVDIVPTIMGRLKGATTQQCWGRDLINLAAADPGTGIIKPSGDSQLVGILQGDTILIKGQHSEAKTYRYQLGKTPSAETIGNDTANANLEQRLLAYVQTATSSLLQNTTGATD